MKELVINWLFYRLYNTEISHNFGIDFCYDYTSYSHSI